MGGDERGEAMMKTTMMKLMTKDRQARIFLLDSTALIRELLKKQQLDPVTKEALATTLTMSGLLCGLMKDGQRLSIQVNTSNPLAYIRCDVEANGNVRGYVSDELEGHRAKACNIAELIGNRGFIRVTKDIGMGSMFTSTVDMPYQTIVEDFSHFFRKSEQTETVFRYYSCYNEESEILYSRGILFQPLPFAESELLARWSEWMDQNDHKFRVPDLDAGERGLSDCLLDADLVGVEEMQLFCGCSKEMLVGLLYGLGQDELAEAMRQKQDLEIVCSGCGKKYVYNAKDIVSLLK
ncbi:33 kDa chaperonin [bioreactor metagenome]|uniref:Chaperonin HslO n=5 Tax=root TaxID=1 RepID=Q24YF5_DESHY|nr:chaperonin HslO [Desulfitobacterium hafniense]BAE82937.1 hypothetical protein DSY1148 [Desulfitobacterium hafniense Y51]